MLTYIIRRVLYSIPVLVATSFLIFTFVSITGDPVSICQMPSPAATTHASAIASSSCHRARSVVASPRTTQ